MDIYFDKKYAELYENIENGVAVEYKFSNDCGEIVNLFIKREIPVSINGYKWYDITTPYGYGGPRISKLNASSLKNDLINQFKIDFEQYCLKNRIVSEFVRFHPVLQNDKDFDSVYNCCYIRKTVGTNLKDYETPEETEFSKKCRKNIRQAINKGVSWKVSIRPTERDISVFEEIYYSTMDRNKASDYYYFDNTYFMGILEKFRDNLLFIEAIYGAKTIAAGLYFISDGIIHIHLSGTLNEYLYLSPAYVLRYAVTLWGKENGYKLIHHGGGRTNDPNDSLYKFKKQFGVNTEFDFVIGKKIWNKQVYNLLCEQTDLNPDDEFFPAYRKRG